jgi:hypothetical protein
MQSAAEQDNASQPGWWLLILALIAMVPAAGGLFIPFIGDDFALLSLHLPTHPAEFHEWLWSPAVNFPSGGAYRPLSEECLALETLLFGAHPWGFHLISLLLHTLATLLTFALVRALLPPRPLVAFCAGLIFALHPIHADALFWLPARAELLSTVCYLASLILYLRGKGPQARRAPTILALLLFLLALLSRESSWSLALVIVFLDLAAPAEPQPLPWRARLSHHRRRYLWFFAVGAAYFIFRALLLKIWPAVPSVNISQTLYYLAHSFKLLLLPIQTHTGLRGGVVLVLTGLSIVVLFLHHAHPGDRRNMMLALGWLLLMLLPTLGNVRREQLYLPSTGLAFFVGIIAAGLLRSRPALAPWLRQASLLVFALLLCGSYGVILMHGALYRQAGRLASEVLQDLQRSLPHPSPGQTFFVANLPGVISSWSGDAPVFAFGFSEAIQLTYRREDLVGEAVSTLYLRAKEVARPRAHRLATGEIVLQSGAGAYAFSFHLPQLTTGRDRARVGKSLPFDRWSARLDAVEQEWVTRVTIRPLEPLEPFWAWDGEKLQRLDAVPPRARRP